jgi:tRNA(Ile)-lysidine synthase
MALVLLAKEWADARGGKVLGLIVDHGLRRGSAAEASLVQQRLSLLDIPARILTLHDVGQGADAARQARYAALEAECAREGIVHLLVGHHAADQAETLQIRALAGSGIAGFSGMPTLRETHNVRLLRPLLGWPPERLRQYLIDKNVSWVEDPSNASHRAQRGRLRSRGAKRAASAVPALSRAAILAGERRAATERDVAAWLGAHAEISPLGYALIPAGPLPVAVLSALIQMISGAVYPPASSQIAPLAARPLAATVAGVMMRPAGRMGDGWLLVREEAAIGPPASLAPGVLWDGRFRLHGESAALPKSWFIAQLGRDAASLRRRTALPSLVLRGLPCIRIGWGGEETLAAVPHIGYTIYSAAEALRLQFYPARPAACALWSNPRLTGGAQ